jgi:polygalacturonase
MPSKNITVRRAYSGCRGGFTIGSEMSGGVEDVSFIDCISTGESGIRISSELGRGGYVRNVLFKNISFSWEKVQGKTFLLHVAQDYRPDNPNKTLSYFRCVVACSGVAVARSGVLLDL